MKKVLIWIVIVMLYLNFGWGLGTYYHENIFGKTPHGFLQKVLAGGWSLFSRQSPDTLNQVSSMLVWPFILAFTMLTWAFYVIYLFINWLLWLAFAGGLVKTFGLGGLIAGSIVVSCVLILARTLNFRR